MIIFGEGLKNILALWECTSTADANYSRARTCTFTLNTPLFVCRYEARAVYRNRIWRRSAWAECYESCRTRMPKRHRIQFYSVHRCPDPWWYVRVCVFVRICMNGHAHTHRAALHAYRNAIEFNYILSITALIPGGMYCLHVCIFPTGTYIGVCALGSRGNVYIFVRIVSRYTLHRHTSACWNAIEIQFYSVYLCSDCWWYVHICYGYNIYINTHP